MACDGDFGAYLLLFSQALSAVLNGMDVRLFHSKEIIQLKIRSHPKKSGPLKPNLPQPKI